LSFIKFLHFLNRGKYYLVMCSFFLLLSTANAQTSWQQSGGPMGGFVYSSIIAPNGYIYTLADIGVYFSTNNGDSWDNWDILPDQTVYGIAVDSSNNVYFSADSGVYMYNFQSKSVTWLNLINQAPNPIALDESGAIYAGSSIGEGLWKFSLLSGTWTQLGLEGDTISSIALESTGAIWAGTTNGLYHRNTTGVWAGPILTDEYINTVFLKGADTILVGLGIVDTAQNLMAASLDGGLTWNILDLNLADSQNIYNINAFAVNGQDAIIAGSDAGLFVLQPGNLVWQEIDTLLINSLCQRSGGIIAGTDGEGVLYSSNGSANWQQTGVPVPINTLMLSSTGLIFAGNDGGIFVSNDRGTTWTQSGLIGINILALAESSNGIIYAGMDVNNGGLWESSDNGNTWIWDAYLGNYSVLSLCPGPNGTMYAGTGAFFDGETEAGIFLTSNNSLSSTGMTWKSLGLSNLEDNAIVLDFNDFLYVGTDNGVYISSNNGANWSSPSFAGEGIFPNSLILDSNGYVFAGTDTVGLYITTNQGVAWTQVDPSDSILYALTAAASNQIYISSEKGVFISTDDGITWGSADAGLSDNDFVISFAMDMNGYVYAGTGINFGDSVSGVAVTTSTTPVNEKHAVQLGTADLLSTYPSPFASSTSITFQLNASEPVSLKIYNDIGEEIGNVVQGYYAPGTYTVQWNAGGAPAGTYFCKLISGGTTAVKELIRVP